MSRAVGGPAESLRIWVQEKAKELFVKLFVKRSQEENGVREPNTSVKLS